MKKKQQTQMDSQNTGQQGEALPQEMERLKRFCGYYEGIIEHCPKKA